MRATVPPRPDLPATVRLMRAVALAAVLLVAAWVPAPAAEPVVEGRDYVVIADGRPWQPLEGRIEVAEVFGYWCHVCDAFQPLVDAWTTSLPRDVRFSYVPAAFSPTDAYARAYFAAESLGVLQRTHHATFDAIHHAQTLPQRNASVDEVAALYAGLGVDADTLKAAMRSPATDARMAAAREFAVRSGVEGTPTVIVNGRYRVQARSLRDLLRIADALVARERAAAGTR
jgi:protein dithiol oxidoreductase (disulfide-forming)